MSPQRPLLTEIQGRLAKEKYLKGPEPFSQNKNKGEFGDDKQQRVHLYFNVTIYISEFTSTIL